MFSDFLLRKGVTEPYLSSDYFDYIDGKPRYEGVRSFLHSRGISLPDGEPSDPPTAETVCGLGIARTKCCCPLGRRRRHPVSRHGRVA